MMEKADEAMEENESESMMEKTPSERGEMMQTSSGSYEDYSPEKVASADGKIVLFFRASWCPTCRALDEMIKAEEKSIPKDVTILKLDYDSSTAQKQKYGVTTQHTLVQVDNKGEVVGKWIGSQNLAQVLANLK
jgi:thiol-disulfide isomerase/thioredoxin